MHARCVEVFIDTTFVVHPVKTTDDEAVNHIDHRLGHPGLAVAADTLEGVHAFLDDHLRDVQAFLDHRHLVALPTIEADHLVGAVRRHHAHAVSSRVGLDDHEGALLDTVLAVFFADQGQNPFHVGGQTLLALPFVEVDVSANREIRVDPPRVDADQLGEFVSNFVVSGEVVGLAP